MITETSVLNNRYRLEKKVGQGGFAQVFLATDLLLERRVALKVLNSELNDDTDFLERFSREAKAIATLDHPNILAIHDFGQAEDTAYLVTPYIEGGTLYDKMRQEKNIPPAMAARYLRQVASALDYAHRRNIVHRDIKPHNMLLRSEDSHLFLADFGIAKVLSSASSQSRTSAIGTISYMSPEQLAGNVGKATDIYALGCVLFQMLVGQVPFTGPTEQVIMGHINGEIPSVVQRSQGRLSESMQTVFDRALAKQPEDRYQSALELSLAFEAALEGPGLTNPLPDSGGYLDPNARTQYAATEIRIPTITPQVGPTGYNLHQSQPRTVNPPPGVVYGNPAVSNTPPYPVAGGAATPPGYPHQAAWNTGPGAPPPQKKSPNFLLFGGLGLVIVALLAVIAALALSNSAPNNTQTPIAAVPTQTATVPATNPAVTAAATQTPVNSPNTVTPEPGLPATTSAASTTAAPTEVPTTQAALPTITPAPPTATVAPVPTTNPPAPTLNVDRGAINNALSNLPGTYSAFIILPDNRTIEAEPDLALPSASTIKFWIAATCFEEAKAGRFNLADNHRVVSSDIASGTGILSSNVGKVYTYGALITTMLTYSDNSAANLLINKLGGMAKINNYIQANNYKATKLQRFLGDVNNPNNNFTSARDTATFLQRVLQGNIVDKASSDLILGALQARRTYAADQNFFGTRLNGFQKDNYLHISGTGTRVRNEVGAVPIADSGSVIIAILDSDMPNESAAENSIATAVQVISQAIKR
jgi:serine/threonine protein kinase/beta-lactamase class A